MADSPLRNAAKPTAAELQTAYTGLQGFQGPGDDAQGSVWQNGNLHMTRNMDTGAWENLTSDDPTQQALIDGGGFKYNAGNDTHATTTQDQTKTDAIMPKTAGGLSYSQIHQIGGGGAEMGGVEKNADGTYKIKHGNAMDIHDDTDLTLDPTYGYITHAGNMTPHEDTWDKVSGTYLPMAIAAGLTAGGLGAIGLVGGAGAGLGSGGMSAFNTAGNAILSGHIDPVSVAASLASYGTSMIPSSVVSSIPPEILTGLGYAKTAYGWYKNPIGSAVNTGISMLNHG